MNAPFIFCAFRSIIYNGKFTSVSSYLIANGNMIRIATGWQHRWKKPTEEPLPREVVHGPFKDCVAEPLPYVGVLKNSRFGNLRSGIPDPWMEFVTFGCLPKEDLLEQDREMCACDLECVRALRNERDIYLGQGIPDPWKFWPVCKGSTQDVTFDDVQRELRHHCARLTRGPGHSKYNLTRKTCPCCASKQTNTIDIESTSWEKQDEQVAKEEKETLSEGTQTVPKGRRNSSTQTDVRKKGLKKKKKEKREKHIENDCSCERVLEECPCKVAGLTSPSPQPPTEQSIVIQYPTFVLCTCKYSKPNQCSCCKCTGRSRRNTKDVRRPSHET